MLHMFNVESSTRRTCIVPTFARFLAYIVAAAVHEKMTFTMIFRNIYSLEPKMMNGRFIQIRKLFTVQYCLNFIFSTQHRTHSILLPKN